MEGVLNRINIGISTTSTTSHSTSKSSGGLYKGDDYLRSTSTGTSVSGHVPTGSLYPPNTGLAPYTYDSKLYHEKGPDEPGTDRNRNKRGGGGNDSDSDSDGSVGNASLDLASSHSSDEDEDSDGGPSWEKQVPKNKKVEEAKEQARKKKKELEEADKQISSQPPGYSTVIPQNQNYGHWPGDPNLSSFQMSESDYRQSEPTISSVPPDVTLPAQELQGHKEYIIPPVRTDSLLNDSFSSINRGSIHPPHDRMKVQVLTHNGSISSLSDSECSHETSV